MQLDQVAQARARRDSSSVVLSKFLAIRAQAPELPVAVIEGKDDVGVWSVWFARSGYNGPIELLPGGGKDKVFELRGRISRSKRVAESKVIYIIDRDYDDWKGNEERNDTFMTDRYSIENYFVCDRVVDHILNTSFHCAGDLSCKVEIIKSFNNCLVSYQNSSKLTHLHTFIKRKMNDRSSQSLPDRFRDIVQLVGKLDFEEIDVSDLKVNLPEGLDSAVIGQFTAEFEALPFVERARGKFHRVFMEYYFSVLQSEKLKADRSLFPKDKNEGHFKYSAFNIVECAGVSPMPLDLVEFVNRNLVSDVGDDQ